METTWIVSVIDRGMDCEFEVQAPTADAAKREAKNFFPAGAKIVKAVRA